MSPAQKANLFIKSEVDYGILAATHLDSGSEDMDARLCSLCRAIFDNWDTVVEQEKSYWRTESNEVVVPEDPKVTRTHHASFDALQASATRGCPFCTLLLRAFRYEHPESNTYPNFKSWESQSGELWFYIKDGHMNGDWTAEARFNNTPTTLGNHKVFLLPVSDTSINSPRESKYSRKAESYEQTLQLTKHWLDRCLSDHKKCSPSSKFTPKRLISLNSDKLQLFIPPEASHPQYITLSHCWGDHDIFRLLRSNFDSLCAGIDPNTLCLTFRDAISFTRDLGFQYLWIDSLCIIQDDAQDWLRESSTMGDIYRHAIMNIAATSSQNGDQGCFQDRDISYIPRYRVRTNHAILDYLRDRDEYSFFPQTSQASDHSRPSSCSLPSPFVNGESLTIEIDATNPAYYELMGGLWTQHSSRSSEVPIDDSADSLFNGVENDMVFYDCVDSNFYVQNLIDTPLGRRAWVVQERLLASRTVHLSTNQLFWECRQQKASDAFPHQFPTQLIPFSHQSGFWNIIEWEAIIAQYSRCSLTRSTDKLIAISGIAKTFGKYGPEEYLAGIWSKKEFCKQLCWTTESAGNRPLTYIAPSWSWASIDSPISLGGISDGAYCNWTPNRTYIKLLKSRLDLLSDDPYGGLTKGILWLGCSILLHTIIDCYVPSGIYRKLPGIVIPIMIVWDCDDQFPHDKFFLLPVYRSTTEFVGLVLLPTLVERGQYRRMGSFITEKKRDLQDDSEFETQTLTYRAGKSDFIEEFQGDGGEILPQVLMLI